MKLSYLMNISNIMVTSLENSITKLIQIWAEAVNVHFALMFLGKAFFYSPNDR